MRGSSGTAASSPSKQAARSAPPPMSRPKRRCPPPVSTASRTPPSARRRKRAASSGSGTERAGPRAKGMVQKVQRWSQPCWISTKARTDEGAASAAKRRKSSPSPAATPCPAPPPSPAPASAKRPEPPGPPDGRPARPKRGGSVVAVGKDGIDRLHPGPALRREGDSAAGGDDPGAGVAAAQAAQGLAGLTLGLGGDSAAVTTRKGRERARRWPAMTALSHALRRQPRVTTSASPAPPSPEPRPETGPETGPACPAPAAAGAAAAADAAEGGAGRAAGAQEPGMKGQDKRATSARSAGPERGQARPLVIAQRCGGRGSGGCGVHSL